MPAKVVEYAEQINPDGSYNVIALDGDRRIEVQFDANAMQQVCSTFQISAIQHASELAKNVPAPIFEARAVNAAHRGVESQLMVSTLQIGSFVLQASNQFLQHMKQEIDRVLTYRSGPTTVN